MLLAISDWRSHRLTACLAACLAVAAASGALAGEPITPPDGGVASTDAERFCANIGDAASDARFAWEAKTLKDLRSEVDAATTALESKRADLEKWVARREEFEKLAQQSVVDIFSKMPAESAAAQLAALDERTAAAVLIKLNSRTAGAILTEMDVPRAVSLAQLISDGGEPKPKSAARK